MFRMLFQERCAVKVLLSRKYDLDDKLLINKIVKLKLFCRPKLWHGYSRTGEENFFWGMVFELWLKMYIYTKIFLIKKTSVLSQLLNILSTIFWTIQALHKEIVSNSPKSKHTDRALSWKLILQVKSSKSNIVNFEVVPVSYFLLCAGICEFES